MKLLATAFVALLCTATFAQFYSTGADPQRTYFQQINTPSFRLVYDSCAQPLALPLAQFIDTLCARGATSLGEKPKHFDVLMHSQMALSNGTVVWAPKRMELYPYAGADDDCVPYMHRLLTHEFRHVAQMNMLNHGFSRFLFVLFGQQSTGLIAGAYIPKWLMEGDAGVTETALSQGGRGRRASFLQEFRAALLTQSMPSYEQAYFGSYKRYLPDYYRLGYLLTSSARLRFGPEIWADALSLSGRKSWSVTPFSRSLKHTSGMRKIGNYHAAMDYWRGLWLRQDSSIVPTPKTSLTVRHSDWQSFISAQQPTSGLVAFPCSPATLDAIVLVDSVGHTRRLTTPSSRNDYRISACGDTIVWTERRGHIRWENAATEELMMLDLSTGRKRRITRGARLSAPSINQSGRVVATSQDDAALQHLSIFDLEGNVLADTLLSPMNEVAWPQWVDNQWVAVVAKSTEGKAIELWNTRSWQRKTVLPASHQNIRHLAVHDGQIYFTSDISGVDNIYRVDLNGGPAQRLTSSRFGAAWPTIIGDKLIYSDYTENGYDICATSLSIRPLDTPISPLHDVAQQLAEQEKNIHTSTTDTLTGNHIATPRHYSKWNILNLHSWGLLTVDADATTITPGLSQASQNLLGTTIIQAGINWQHDKDELLFASVSYNALWPKLSLSATYGYEQYTLRGYILNEATEQYRAYTYIDMDSREKIYKLKLAISQPLNLSSGAWSRCIMPYISAQLHKYTGLSYNYQDIIVSQRGTQYGQTKTYTYADTNIANLSYTLYAYALRRTAARDIGTRLGLSLLARYRHTPWGLDYGDVLSAQAYLYLPGIGRHHQIWLSAQTQKKHLSTDGTSIYHFSDDISHPRGTSATANSQLHLLKLNYNLPLWNADLSLGPVAHIKRIALQAFYDIAKGRYATQLTDNERFRQRSSGAELTAETYILRLPYPITIGYRHSYTFHRHAHDLLLSVSFY